MSLDLTEFGFAEREVATVQRIQARPEWQRDREAKGPLPLPRSLEDCTPTQRRMAAIALGDARALELWGPGPWLQSEVRARYGRRKKRDEAV